jgi:serine/threonine protein kinase
MIGTKLAHYEITSHLGTGGMGEVYEALDTKLGRSVAVKFLPEAFAGDADRVPRFAREARVLASLNHPNIAAIYGVEDSGGRKFLVMELVPGETLADQIRRGPLPVDEALAAATQMAVALEAAHQKGVVHRDLKPANIKITPQGQVKVLDFGLAKAFAGEAVEVQLSNSPTLGVAGTNAGLIMGTAAYMSPEQAKGKETDRACDIWAFGCVLYEMLSGRAAFEGETIGEILGSVFKSEPDWAALPPSTPPSIVVLLKRCLQKDPSRRLRDIADARFQIEEAAAEPVSRPVLPAARKSGERLLWIAAVLALAVGLAFSIAFNRGAPAGLPEMRLEISTAPGSDISGFSLSPDGRQLAYRAAVDGKPQLWLRSLESETAQPLMGTENGSMPFWSPDSRSIGFFADGQLKRIDIAGALVRSLADAPVARGGAWASDGTILFAHSSVEPLYRIPAGGGKSQPATELKAPHRGHRYPQFLPDGRHFVFFAFGPTESQGVYVGSLDSMETQRLMDSDSTAFFTPPDYLLFARQGAVLAQRVDLKAFKTIGDPLPVARQATTQTGFVADLALSTSGVGPIAYRPDAGERQLRWVGRSGQQLEFLGGPDAAQPAAPRISPDGRTVILERLVSGRFNLWLMETTRDVRQRFTTSPAYEYDPLWSPDGNRIVYGSTRKGAVDLYEKPLSGGAETVLLESPESKNAYDWSPDGRWIVYAVQNPTTGRDLWALPMEGEKKPVAIAQTPYEEEEARFSPDGRWVAFESNESGRYEIYIQAFPGAGRKSQISSGGGRFPQWRKDGKELFYLRPDNRLVAQSVNLSGSVVEPGSATPLFSLSPGGTYTAAPDGQRFLLNEITKPAAPITILLNWRPR